MSRVSHFDFKTFGHELTKSTCNHQFVFDSGFRGKICLHCGETKPYTGKYRPCWLTGHTLYVVETPNKISSAPGWCGECGCLYDTHTGHVIRAQPTPW